MKKLISLILCIMMLSVLLLPTASFAAGEKELESIIKLAKTNFDIPDTFSFNFDVYTQNNKKVWSLYWNSKNSSGESISVRIDEDKVIQSYDHYIPFDYSKRKLPKISKADAKAKAEAFIKKINSGVWTQLKFVDNGQSSLLDYAYYFNYIRTVKGVPYYSNSISVSVNKDTGAVMNYYNNWEGAREFPDAAKALSLAAAEKAFKDQLGLELIYKYSYLEDTIKLYPVYTTRLSNDSYAIDALSGEKVQTGYAGIMYGAGGNEFTMQKSYSMDSAAVTLTPEEIKAIDEAAKLLTKEDAEKLARGYSFLNIGEDLKLEYANLSRSWPIRTKYQWQLNFNKIINEKTGEAQYIYVNLDATTGELLNYSKNVYPYDMKQTPKFNEAAAKEAVESFVIKVHPDKFKETELDTSNSNNKISLSESGEPLQFNFSYTRKVNGVRFPDNYMNVTFDAVSGEVISFQMTWFDGVFPSVSKAISLESAYAEMFKTVGLELQYKTIFPGDAANKMLMPPSSIDQKVRPVFALKNGKPLFIDAFSGQLLDYDGKVYKEVKPVQYKDIAGHYAEKKIRILTEYGVSLEGDKFRPNEGITQKDFLILLSRTMNNYYGPGITSESSDKELESLYETMIREGIIKAGEKAPKSLLRREDGVKFIIRAMKLEKVADIKGIFKFSFKDMNRVTKELDGYIVIAQGLKIIEGYKGSFRPKVSLTRGDTMIMLYNYLAN